MNSRIKYSLASLAALVFAGSLSAAIMSAEERADKLKSARDLLSRSVKPIEGDLLAAAPDPFRPDLGNVEKKVEKKAVQLSDAELLPLLAAYIRPTGIFAFGGENYLIFKEKKLKIGSEMDVMYNGTEYKVVITEITGTTYTVALGTAELQLKLK